MLNDMWEAAKQHLKSEMTSLSFNTYINDALSVVSLENDTLTLEAAEEYKRSMITTRYMGLLKEAVKKAALRDINVVILSPGEREKPSGDSFHTRNQSLSQLNPKYTFDTFVIGSSNRFAHAASLAVAESPARSYNPLFLYGGVGLGKTHLMHAIGHYILNNNSSARIMYVTSERFTNELITSIQMGKPGDFRDKYRNVDVLLVDDIQFIADKERTQEEFFHTFNTLHESNKQIIISSDKQPKEMTTLEERLRSRFEWGLIADIQRPDFETRVAILRKKAQMEYLNLDDSVLTFIANKIESNIRELEGSLTRVIAYSALTKHPPTIELVEEALKDFFPRRKRQVSAPIVMEAVGDYFNLSVADFKAKRRTRELANARQIAMYITRTLTDLSLPKIGEEFGGRDHTTVMHACDKVVQQMQEDSSFKNLVEDLIKNITE